MLAQAEKGEVEHTGLKFEKTIAKKNVESAESVKNYPLFIKKASDLQKAVTNSRAQGASRSKISGRMSALQHFYEAEQTKTNYKAY